MVGRTCKNVYREQMAHRKEMNVLHREILKSLAGFVSRYLELMGYDYTVYKRQLDEYNNKKRDLYRLLRKEQDIGNVELVKQIQADIERLGDFKLVPVITIILNFSRIRWSKARSLKELVPAGHPEIVAHMQDYDVEIFDVLYLDEATRSGFTSDFRDALDMIYAYTKDERYLKIRNEVIKKEMKAEVIRVSEFLDELEKNKVIETVKKQYERKHNDEYAISFIECGLNISSEEARVIFETEVLGVALA